MPPSSSIKLSIIDNQMELFDDRRINVPKKRKKFGRKNKIALQKSRSCLLFNMLKFVNNQDI